MVVGDPKQLPPTSFFQRTASVDEEEAEVEVDTELLDEESILDLCNDLQSGASPRGITARGTAA